MGLHSSVTIQLQSSVDPVTVLNILISTAWRYDAYGTISYLPLGDEGMFDWQFVVSDKWHQVKEIFDLKERRGETIGIALTWESTSIGGHFLFHQDGKIQVSLNINRVPLSVGLSYTDFSWYLSKLLPIFMKEQIHIEAIECLDSW